MIRLSNLTLLIGTRLKNDLKVHSLPASQVIFLWTFEVRETMKEVFAFVLLFATAFAHPANIPLELPYAMYENDGLERALTPEDRNNYKLLNSTETE